MRKGNEKEEARNTDGKDEMWEMKISQEYQRRAYIL